MQNGRLTLAPPPPRSPLDQLAPEFVRIHQAGIVRALASSLDCLAGVVIGVVALPMSILRADFDRARARLNKITAASDDGERMQARFAGRLEASILSAGPTGWLDWTLDFRNMLVHRGRRLEHGQVLRRTPVLLGPDGEELLRARRVGHLPRDPARSDVEVLLEGNTRFLLTEEAGRTLNGLIGSTRNLIEALAEELLTLWHWRRVHPDALPPPAAQWKDGPAHNSTGFNGYAPGSLGLEPGMGITHPITARRIRAAALDDTDRPQWSKFD